MPRGDVAIDFCTFFLRGHQTRLPGRKAHPPEERHLSLIIFRTAKISGQIIFPVLKCRDFFILTG